MVLNQKVKLLQTVLIQRLLMEISLDSRTIVDRRVTIIPVAISTNKLPWAEVISSYKETHPIVVPAGF